jgi:cysteine desulfurase / selenocysteine lyase
MSIVEEQTAKTQRGALDAREVARLRQDFPILSITPHGKPLVYLDNAATSQTPQQVIDAIATYYREQNANVHRGVHYLSQLATDKYELARHKVRQFINAALPCEIVFTRGTTESINLVATSYGRQHVKQGDEVLITHMEHHSNIVPWQMLCQQTGATLKVVPINDDGELIMEEFEKLLSEKTKIVAVVHVSNALGTVNPVKQIVSMAHDVGAVVVVDAAQSAPHMAIDVKDLDCDFLALSAHKMFGPTGFGVLFGKAKHLNDMPPYQGGGDMIRSVTFEKTTYNELPYKFEAGTPHIEGAIAFGATIDYLNDVGMDRIAAYEADVLRYGEQALSAIDGIRLVGTARSKAGVLGFVMDDAHPHDIGQILDEEGVAIRAGHHCAQPVMQRFGVPATARASLAFYNTEDEIDALVRGIQKVKEVFGS